MGKKKRSFNAFYDGQRRADPFIDFTEDEDFDEFPILLDEDGYPLDFEPSEYMDEPDVFGQPRIHFDYDMWRDDLANRSTNRLRMRERDKNKGLY